jgi:hypothetical protein
MTTEKRSVESRLRNALHAAERDAPLPPDFAASIADTVPERSPARTGPQRLILPLMAAVAGVLVVAVVAVALQRPEPPAPGADADAVEGLFANTAECRAKLAGHTVVITYPSTWWTNEASSEFPACFWFAPEQMAVPHSRASRPAGVAITIGSVGGSFGSWAADAEPEDVTIAGREGIRVEELGGSPGYGDGRPALVYQVALGEAATDGPTLVAVTRQADSGDYSLNKAVLDRMMQLLVIE